MLYLYIFKINYSKQSIYIDLKNIIMTLQLIQFNSSKPFYKKFSLLHEI